MGESELKEITIYNFKTFSGNYYNNLKLTYRVFGDFDKLNNSGVLVCHAMTGNSNVSGENGWWQNFIGENKPINTNEFPVICFDIPGNGSNEFFFENDEYKQWNVRDLAHLFHKGLEKLKIQHLYACIGLSLGGGVSWEMTIRYPNLFKYHIAIGTHFESTDWIIGHNYIQSEILKSSHNPLETARMMALLFYRTSISFSKRFKRKLSENGFYDVENYLEYQGKKLLNRFDIRAYKLMNHLLANIDITQGKNNYEEILSKIQAKTIIIAIEPDLLFDPAELKKGYDVLKKLNKNVDFRHLEAEHGHDSFLIEGDKLGNLLIDIFPINN